MLPLITSLGPTTDTIRKVRELFKECEAIIEWETKRRQYVSQLEKVLKERERKETVKRITMNNRFKRQPQPLKIPSPPSSQTSNQAAIDAP